MDESEDPGISARPGRRVSLQTLAVSLGLIGLIATIISFVFPLLPGRTQLVVDVISVDELTALPGVNGLVGTYKYHGISVSHLWRWRASLTNTGDTTLVGVGPGANVLHDGVYLAFPASADILSIGIELNDVGASATTTDANVIKVEFEQWRSDEKLVVNVLLSVGVSLADPPVPEPLGRQIVDGDVRVETTYGIDETPRKTYLSGWPKPILISIRVAVIMVLIVVGGISAVFGVASVWEYFQWTRWIGGKHTWKAQLHSFLENDTNISQDLRSALGEALDHFTQHPLSRARFVNRYKGKASVVQKRKMWKYFARSLSN